MVCFIIIFSFINRFCWSISSRHSVQFAQIVCCVHIWKVRQLTASYLAHLGMLFVQSVDELLRSVCCLEWLYSHNASDEVQTKQIKTKKRKSSTFGFQQLASLFLFSLTSCNNFNSKSGNNMFQYFRDFFFFFYGFYNILNHHIKVTAVLPFWFDSLFCCSMWWKSCHTDSKLIAGYFFSKRFPLYLSRLCKYGRTIYLVKSNREKIIWKKGKTL